MVFGRVVAGFGIEGTWNFIQKPMKNAQKIQEESMPKRDLKKKPTWSRFFSDLEGMLSPKTHPKTEEKLEKKAMNFELQLQSRTA